MYIFLFRKKRRDGHENGWLVWLDGTVHGELEAALRWYGRNTAPDDIDIRLMYMESVEILATRAYER